MHEHLKYNNYKVNILNGKAELNEKIVSVKLLVIVIIRFLNQILLKNHVIKAGIVKTCESVPEKEFLKLIRATPS